MEVIEFLRKQEESESGLLRWGRSEPNRAGEVSNVNMDNGAIRFRNAKCDFAASEYSRDIFFRQGEIVPGVFRYVIS